MSKWGRAQDALHDLWESPNGYGPPDDGIAKQVLAPHGVTQAEWSSLIEDILEAVAWPFGYFTRASGSTAEQGSAATESETREHNGPDAVRSGNPTRIRSVASGGRSHRSCPRRSRPLPTPPPLGR